MPSGDTRRLVTVAFYDVTGSTALGRTRDPESVRAVLHRFFEEMRAVVSRHGGTVEKFVGDAVLAVFGIPQAHEDDALRAVRAAAEMREALALLNKELERDFGVAIEARAGLCSGEVVAGEAPEGGSYVTGHAVNVAARLQQAALPGEILMSEETHGLVRDAVLTERLEPLALKGIDEGVRAFRLLGVVPGAAAHSRRFDSPLVDREGELTLLLQAFERAASHRQCQLFTILGAAGVGKSRLVDEFVGRVGDRARVLRGRCLPYGEGITVLPIAEVVAEAAGFDAADPQEAARGKIARLMEEERDGARVADRVAQAIGIGVGPPAPEETPWAIRIFLEAFARRRPLVVVFEDIQWGEPTFLDLVEHAADWSRDAAIMLACLARPELLEARSTWGGGKLNATSALLEPLDEAQTDALVGNLLGEVELDAEVRRRIVETAGGNPLFVEEIVSMLIDGGDLVLEGGRWVPTRDLSGVFLPPTISALLTARLDRLEPEERAVIERASVVGKVFDTAAVAALCSEDIAPAAGTHLSSLVRKELILPARATHPEGGFRFRHLLIRDAAYGSIPKRSRADLHQRCAEWLESRAAGRTEEQEELIGYHLEQSHRYLAELGPVDDRGRELSRRAGLRLAAAGRRAVLRGDVPATANLLGRAAGLLAPGDPDRLQLLPDLAESLFQAGETWRASSLLEEMLERARAAGDRRLEARALLDRSSWRLVTDPKAIAAEELRDVAETAAAVFEELGEEGDLASALEPLAITHRLFTGDIRAMLDASERALELARRAGNWPVVAGSALHVGQALVLGTTPCGQALARLEELAELFAAERMVWASIGLYMATILGMLGRFGDAWERANESRDVFEDLGQRRWVAETSIVQGVIARWEGDAEGAEPRIRFAFESFRKSGEAADAALAGIDLAQVLYDLDRLDEADSLTEFVRREMPALGLEPQAGWRRVRAKVRARGGALDEAEALAREAEQLLRGTDLLTLRCGVLMDLAVVLQLAGRADEAGDAALEALEGFRRKETPVGARAAEELLAGLGPPPV